MADKRLKANPIEVRGNTYQVYLTDHNEFVAEVPLGDGEKKVVSSKTIEGLRDLLGNVTRRKAIKVAVPFVEVMGTKLRDGVATGIHQGSGKVLVAWADGHKDQIGGYYTQKYLRPLDPAERVELQRLLEEDKKASDALQEFLRKRYTEVANLVKKAIEEVERKEQTGAAK
jgi:hypothetical protein